MVANERKGPMRCHAILLIISLPAGLAAALAQPTQNGTTSSPPAAVTMEEPAPGDHWAYEIRDEILGTVKSTRTNVVTEVTPKEISMAVRFSGNPNTGLGIFDRLWDVTSAGDWRYTPNDGTGVRLPLAVGKTWSFKSNNVNSRNGDSWNRSGTSKVVAQESVTTRAGTFDAFKIEISYTDRNVGNAGRTNQNTIETWYAPAIDHWVKRTFTSRVDGHLRENTTETLTEYGRRHQ